MQASREITVKAKKYDGRVRKSWVGGLLSGSDDPIVLIAKFTDEVRHNDIGHIKAGTISFEYFWLDRWYNIFRFHEPDGQLLAHYINIAMPANIEGDTLSYVDLDMDVVVWPTGQVDVLDRDDFEKNTVKYSYPLGIVERAEAALVEVMNLIENGQLP